MNQEIAHTILNQIRNNSFDLNSGAHLMMCWGFTKPTVIQNGLQFNVKGRIHRGLVRVIYDEGSDTYSVELGKIWKLEYKMKQRIDNVYCDQLLGLIDGLVESSLCSL